MRIRNFLDANRGNVAMMFALGIIPIFGMVGFALDYTRASNAREKISAAIDSAALSANKNPRLTLAQKTQIAREIITQQLSDTPWINFDAAQIEVLDDNGLLDVSMPATVQTSFMQILGVNTMNVSVAGQSINRIEDGAEIALVLDNTGSMRNDMTAMKDASTNFINEVMPNAYGNVRMAIVPYVASVNPGPSAMNGLMDYQADSKHHAQFFEEGAFVVSAPCQYPPSPPSTPDPNWNPPPPFDPGQGGNESSASLGDWLGRMADAGLGYLGVSQAHAQSVVTPNTTPPFATTPVNIGPPDTVNTLTVQVPQGFKQGGNPCQLWNPEKISHFDLFDRIPGASWRGCVEARPEPFDVTDDAVSSDPNTRFVPYFWPDEPDSTTSWRGQTVMAHNNYMPDFPAAEPLAGLGWDSYLGTLGRQDKTQQILKYNGTTNGGTIDIADTGPDQMGPNKGCPDPIVPLTASTSTLTNAIANLTHKNAGGTINSEGLMWGWRVLSPGAPFTQGKPYGQAKKYLVLMSDGKNEFNENPIDSGDLYSDYTAYGYLGQWETRLSMGVSGDPNGRRVRTFDTGNPDERVNVYLDERFQLACQNVKDSGVIVFTILFRESDANAKQLMSDCASKPGYAFRAPDQASLKSAFAAVASLLINLRLSK